MADGPVFLLVPVNTAARKATENILNSYYQYLDEEGCATGLWINLSDASNPFITLGRAGTNIHLPDTKSSSRGSPQISDLHATFEFIPETGAVLLWDKSAHENVEPFTPPHHGGHSWTVKFRSGARRSVLIARGINSHIAFGKDKWYQFEIQWHSEAMYNFDKDEPYHMGPKQSKTKRYVQLNKLGGGAYGTVYSAMDATTGLLIAVKRFNSLSGKYLTFATREVANLRKKELRQHPHVLRILDSAGGGTGENWGEIFMPLQRGSLKDLLGTMENEEQQWDLSNVVLRQMLLALECLDANDIIHRDVKPDNILWDLDENDEYTFCLADFGLSNDPNVATTTAGTAPFMAPEVFYRKKQTTKIDIWSLYATIVWMRNQEFRAVCSSISAYELHEQLTKTSQLPEYANIRRMAAWNRKHRPSATQQLHILDNGDYEEEYDETEGYAQVEPAYMEEDDLVNQFSQNMSLGESSDPSLTYGSGSSEYPTAPEMAYYEPYAPPISRHQGGQGRKHHGEASDRYYGPPTEGPEAVPRDQGAWVAEYGNTYGESEATAVPATMTAIPVGDVTGHATYYEEYLEERRRLKGKNRSYM
ncbi:kinase-like domain-containing protein [Cladorrhinum sp. PSN259]|nr:kinase-like domain-containing protein [Cladorrhinum sp. PSN259]